MAILFLLAAYFEDYGAMARSLRLAKASEGIWVRGERTPLIARSTSWGELSVVPASMVAAVDRPARVPAHTLTGPEAASVATQLYDILRGMDGYRIAAVGWDPECDVDPDELAGYAAEGTLDSRTGVVLAQDLATDWAVGPAWKPFAAGYRWVPWKEWRPGR